MKIIKILFLICWAVLVESCGSMPSSMSSGADVNHLDQVHLGQSESDVRKIVGDPTEVRTGGDSKDWFYHNHDENRFRNATVSFDLNTGLVVELELVPRADGPEAKLDYLLKHLFPDSDYVTVPLSRCGHYFRPTTFYISPPKGIVLESDDQTSSIVSYSWNTVKYATDLVGKIKNCEH